MPRASDTTRAAIPRALIGALFCAAAFIVVLVLAYGSGTIAHADAVALHGFTTLDTPSVDRLATPVALSMNLEPMLMVLGVLCVLGLAAGRGRHVLLAFAAVAAANVTTQVLKVVLAHERFDPVLGLDQVDAAALPSGHATAAMSIAVAAILIAPRAWRPVVAALSGGYVAAVCFSILVLGWHFPSDVLAGMLVATGFGCLALAVLRSSDVRLRVERTRPGKAAGALDEWAAGAVAAGVLALVGVGVAAARAGAIVDYARDNTVATATAGLVLALGVSLLVAFAALARE